MCDPIHAIQDATTDMTKNKIVIFLPSRVRGGAERQMAMLASFILKNTDISLEVIDSEKKIIINMIKEVRNYTKRIYKRDIPCVVTDSIVVMQASYMFCANMMLKMEGCAVRFWFMHPLNLPHMYIESRLPKILKNIWKSIYIKRYRDRITESDVNHEIYFQDSTAKQTVEKFYGINLKNSMVTGLIESMRKPLKDTFNKSKEKRIYWLGRLERGSKYWSICKIMSELSRLSDKELVLYIIGDGDCFNDLVDYARTLDIETRVKFKGEIEYSELIYEMSGGIAVFCHGSSIFEGIISSIPTVIVDFYENQRLAQESGYRFYSDEESNALGNMIRLENNIRSEKNLTIEEIIYLASHIKTRSEINVKSQKKLAGRPTFSMRELNLMIEYSQDMESRFQNNYLLDALFFKVRGFIKR